MKRRRITARWAVESGYLPVRKSALTTETMKQFVGRHPRNRRAIDMQPYAKPEPNIAGWQQAPARQDRDLWHLAAEVFTIRRAPDKLKYLAGSESAMDVFVNDVVPEQMAQRLRDALR